VLQAGAVGQAAWVKAGTVVLHGEGDPAVLQIDRRGARPDDLSASGSVSSAATMSAPA